MQICHLPICTPCVRKCCPIHTCTPPPHAPLIIFCSPHRPTHNVTPSSACRFTQMQQWWTLIYGLLQTLPIWEVQKQGTGVGLQSSTPSLQVWIMMLWVHHSNGAWLWLNGNDDLCSFTLLLCVELNATWIVNSRHRVTNQFSGVALLIEISSSDNSVVPALSFYAAPMGSKAVSLRCFAVCSRGHYYLDAFVWLLSLPWNTMGASVAVRERWNIPIDDDETFKGGNNNRSFSRAWRRIGRALPRENILFLSARN